MFKLRGIGLRRRRGLFVRCDSTCFWVGLVPFGIGKDIFRAWSIDCSVTRDIAAHPGGEEKSGVVALHICVRQRCACVRRHAHIPASCSLGGEGGPQQWTNRRIDFRQRQSVKILRPPPLV